MGAHYITIFLITFLIQSTTWAKPKPPHFIGESRNRRILHQPLFPVTPEPELFPPPPPPPPATSALPEEEGQPFSNELPAGPVLDQGATPAPPVTSNNAAVVNQSATWQPSKPIKKTAIAISFVILILATVSAFAFYLHKNRVGRPDESQKLVGGNSQRITEEDSSMPPSQPHIRNIANEINGPSGSPYQKLSSEMRFDHSGARLDLQPLPPLVKASSHENVFLAPKGSFVSNKSQTSSLPHSKRTSPKSRFSVGPPQPSPPPPPPTSSLVDPPQPSNTLWYDPKGANLSQLDKIPNPPPLPQSIPRKYETFTSLPVSKQLIRPQIDKATWVADKTSPVEEVNKGVSSLEKLEDEDGSRAKLKHLRWDKVQATSDRATVWDQLKPSSFKLNEDAMDSLFVCNRASLVPKEAPTKMFLPPFVKDDRILDSRKSQNIAILLRALNVTRDEVSEALLDGNPHGLGSDLLGTLVKMAPTKDEEIKLQNYNGESSKLGPAERFLKAILDIPFAFKRVEAMLYIANFESEVKYLRKSFQTLEEASQELKSSRLFLKLLEAVLRTGNRMNDGTNHGDAKAFKLDTLLKLVDIKATDGKTTLVHFVVQEIIKSEGAGYDPTTETLSNKTSFKFREEDFKKQGLQVVAGLSKELSNVKRAATMDSDVLSNYVSKLENGLQKVRDVLEYEDQSIQDKFFGSMKVFLKEAVDEISKVKAEERKSFSLVKDVTQYFHGEAVRVEVSPFRIFVIVRDFLLVLDNVCKDVGRMQDRAMIGAGRSFRIPITASLPVLSRYNVEHSRSSDDDSI